MMGCIFSLVGSICFPFSLAHCLCLPNFHPFFFSSPKSSRVFFQFWCFEMRATEVYRFIGTQTHTYPIQAQDETFLFTVKCQWEKRARDVLLDAPEVAKICCFWIDENEIGSEFFAWAHSYRIVIFLGWASFKSILDGLRAQILAQNCIFIASARIDGTQPNSQLRTRTQMVDIIINVYFYAVAIKISIKRCQSIDLNQHRNKWMQKPPKHTYQIEITIEHE